MSMLNFPLEALVNPNLHFVSRNMSST